MTGLMRLIAWLYSIGLNLYPDSFRGEFGEEMRSVFNNSLMETKGDHAGQPIRILWRELRDLPGLVLQEHFRERKLLMTLDGNINDGIQMDRIAWFFAMLIFILPLLIPVLGFIETVGSTMPSWLNPLIGLILLGIPALGLLYSLVNGFPRWSLPYLGFALMIALVITRFDRIFTWIYPHFFRSFGFIGNWPVGLRIAYNGLFTIIFSILLLLSGVVLISVLRFIPYTSKIWQRFRQDWTQLSFLFYGSFILMIFIEFDEYQYAEIFTFWTFVSLSIGAWIYLTAETRKTQVISLAGGITIAMLIVTISKWILIPYQMWPEGYPISPSEATRWLSMIGATLTWLGMMIVLFAPALVNVLSGKPASSHIPSQDAVST